MSQGETRESNCEYYDQCLGFEDDSTVTALGIGVLTVVIFLFIASLWHRGSNLEHLLFITSRYYLYFYFVCIVNFFAIIISVTFFNYTVDYSQISVGATLILTSVSTMFINLIGCKYYRSYLCMKKLSLRLLLFLGISTLIVSTMFGAMLLYLTIFDSRITVKFEWFLLFVLLITIIHTSIASFASQLAQVEWILLISFTVFYIESYINTVYEPFNLFLIYWHPIVLCFISIASVFGLSPFIQLRYIGLGIFSCFVSMFDLVTDINVIYVWLNNQHFVWASLQTLFILSGVIFSGYYIKDYYGFLKFKDDENINKNDQQNPQMSDEQVNTQPSIDGTYAEYIPSNKLQRIGQVCTCMGLGRLWHGMLGWDLEKNKDMMVSHKILKIWEMLFRCMPALILQFYIVLLSENEEAYDLSVLLSITASSLSVSFTLLRVLYGDHHSMTRKTDFNAFRMKTIDSRDHHKNDSRFEDEWDEMQFKHPSVVGLLMRGYSPNEIDTAYTKIKEMQQYKYVNLEHPQFREIMIEQLENMSQSGDVPMPMPMEEHKQEPTQPSMQAPKPIPLPMISLTINGQQQNAQYMQQQAQVQMSINAQPHAQQMQMQYSPQQMQYAQQQISPYAQQMQMQYPPQQIPLQVPALPVGQQAETQEQQRMNLHEQDNSLDDIDSIAMTSEVSYKDKKNRINWTHPYILHLKDLGWSKQQIQSAYFILKNAQDDERSKIKMDDQKFLAFMINILVKDLKYSPDDEQREFSTTSECIDKMYQNFVCCFCCRILTKINDDNAWCFCCTMLCLINKQASKGYKKSNFTVKDNIFYFGMYMFLITDFYCRIFPFLAYIVLLHRYLESLTNYALLNVVIGVCPMAVLLGLFELGSYYLMLKRSYKSLKSAIKYFWTGYFTISYYLLSTMHLTYLPTNVIFIKLYRSHLIRMIIQVLILCIVIGMQYTLFDHPLGFFERSVFLFVFNWLLNIWIFIWMKCYMVTFTSKINAESIDAYVDMEQELQDIQ